MTRKRGFVTLIIILPRAGHRLVTAIDVNYARPSPAAMPGGPGRESTRFRMLVVESLTCIPSIQEVMPIPVDDFFSKCC
jgi:hypothetical protein